MLTLRQEKERAMRKKDVPISRILDKYTTIKKNNI